MKAVLHIGIVSDARVAIAESVDNFFLVKIRQSRRRSYIEGITSA